MLSNGNARFYSSVKGNSLYISGSKHDVLNGLNTRVLEGVIRINLDSLQRNDLVIREDHVQGTSGQPFSVTSAGLILSTSYLVSAPVGGVELGPLNLEQKYELITPDSTSRTLIINLRDKLQGFPPQTLIGFRPTDFSGRILFPTTMYNLQISTENSTDFHYRLYEYIAP
jgi:hypothetical protein